MWYSSPGSNNMTQSLLIGNGRMGAIVPGGVATDTIILNEDSLWAGTANFSGGYSLGPSASFGDYEMFGSLVLNLPSHTNSTGYVRALDIGTGIATVDYTNNGVEFHRELFCSAPDQVLAMQLTASSNAAYTGSIQLADAHSTTTNTANGLMFSGALANGEQYEAQLVVSNNGGTVSFSGGAVNFTNCNSLTIIVALGTSYVMNYSQNYQGNNPHTNVLAQVTAASVKTFSTLETAHTNDFTALFNRVSIWLGNEPSARTNLPTDQRITANATSDDDPWMEQLMFQYGRYLMISSSRGGLPMNLCGLWNDNNNVSYSEWGDDYHTDINIEMMYWQAEVANLPECFNPLVNWLQSQIPAWRYVTTNASTSINNGGYGYGFGGTNGWTTRTSENINGGQGWNWIQSGNAWYCMHLWEHYAFSGDTNYLLSVYPILKDTCQFWQQHLQPLGANTNGLPVTTLVATNGWSPEHGPWENGVSFDQELIWDVFNNYQKACAILNTDAVYSETVSNLQANLLVPGIGPWGELREWLYYADIQPPNSGYDHRHTSHLVGLFPGHQFTPDQTPALAAAAKVGLLARGDTGDSSSEWAHANRISLFARLLDPVDAHHKLALYCGTIYPNLVASLGGIPQCDGSCGVTAGIAEMLLQSHEGRIALLPALPTNWPAGSVTGLRVRGGFTVDMAWTNGWLTAATIHSVSGTNCIVQYGSQTIQTNIPLGGSDALNWPPVPTGLVATAAATNQINLVWNSFNNGATYNVKRSTTNGGPYTVIATGVTATNYNDTGLAGTTTYYYVVSAVVSGSETPDSAQASAATLSPFVYSWGTPVSFAGLNADQILTNFPGTQIVGAMFAQNGGSSITVTPSSGSTIVFAPANTSWAGLAGGAGYFTGAWTNTTGNTNFDSCLNAFYYDNGPHVITLSNLVVGQQYSVQLFALDDRSGLNPAGSARTVNWQNPADSVNVSATYSMAANDYIVLTFMASNAVQEIQENLLNSGYANFNCLVLRAVLSPPAALAGLTASPGNAQVSLTWSASAGASSYNVKCSTTSGSGYVTITNLTPTSFVDTGLANGSTYYYVVSATNNYGESANSTEVNATPSGSYATNFFWTGAVNTNWDTATVNWRTNGVSAVFFDGGAVVFDDTALSNTTVNLSATRTPASVAVNNSALAYTISGSAIAGTGSLTKSGTNTLTLSGANTFSGGVTNSSGTLTLGNAGALGIGVLTLNGGTLNNNDLYTLTNSIVIASGGGAIQLGSGNNLTLSGGFSGNGAVILGNSANGLSLYLAGTNSMAGGTIMVANNNNYVRFATNAAGNANVDWIFNNTTANQTTFDFASGTINFGSLSGNGFIQGNVSGANSMNVTVSVGGNNNSTMFSGVLHNNGWGTGPIGLTKVGGGTTTLTGANDYSGTTSVSNGELVVSTAFAGSGNFFVNGGATLGVTNLSRSSALVSNLTVTAGAGLEFQNVASTTTPLVAANNITNNGSCNVKIKGTSGLVASNSYPLISYSGTFNGSFTNLQLQMPYAWRGALANVGNQIMLTNVAVVATTPPQMTVAVNGQQLQLFWPQANTGWRLLMNTNLAGTNWADVPGANVTNLMLILPTNGSVFFQLVYP